MKKLEFKTVIAAPVNKVWDTMLQPDSYKQWIGGGWPDSFFEGKLEQGEKISFLSKEGGGTLAEIKKLSMHEYILFVHVAVILPGNIKDTTSELARGWIGITESYSFEKKDQGTELTINITTNTAWEKMFMDGWPGALQQLKELCEK